MMEADPFEAAKEGLRRARMKPDERHALRVKEHEQGYPDVELAQKELTLMTVAVQALLSSQGAEELSGSEKQALSSVARNIQSKGTLSLDSTKITLIKDRINTCCPFPDVVAQAWDMLDLVEQPEPETPAAPEA